jgi:hypothetical protein
MFYTQYAKLAPIMGLFYISNAVKLGPKVRGGNDAKGSASDIRVNPACHGRNGSCQRGHGRPTQTDRSPQKCARTHHDITSFSSSSVLHVGVNHPPKNR